jgi:hypothetical protein
MAKMKKSFRLSSTIGVQGRLFNEVGKNIKGIGKMVPKKKR